MQRLFTPPPLITQDARSGYNSFGVENSYPQATTFYAENDSRAKLCWEWMTTFVIGEKDGNGWQKMINPSGETAGELYDRVCAIVSLHRGAPLHVRYNAYGEIMSMALLPFEWVRLGNSNGGLFKGLVDTAYVWNNWDFNNNSLQRKAWWDKIPLFDYAKAKKEIAELGDKWNTHKGQVLYLSMDGINTYPVSTIHSALTQLDTRAHLNRALQVLSKNGMLGVVYATPTAGNPTPEQQQSVENVVSDHMGADGAGGIMILPENYEIKSVPFAHPQIVDNTQDGLKLDIQECFGVPIELTGEKKAAKLGNADEIANAVKLYNIRTKKMREFVWTRFNALLQLSAFNLSVAQPTEFTIKP